MPHRSSRSRRLSRAAGTLALFPLLLSPAGQIGAGALVTALVAGSLLSKAPLDAPNPAPHSARAPASVLPQANLQEAAPNPEIFVELDGARVPVVLDENAANSPLGVASPGNVPPAFPSAADLPGATSPAPVLVHAPGRRSPSVGSSAAPSPANAAPASQPQSSSPPGDATALTPETPPTAPGPQTAGPWPAPSRPSPGSPLAGNPPAQPTADGSGTPGTITGTPGGSDPHAAPGTPPPAPPGTGAPFPVAGLPPETAGAPVAALIPGGPLATGLPGAPWLQPAAPPRAQNTPNSVPEPGSLMLLSLGGMAFWWMRRPRGRLVAAVRR
ncbi:MAG: PEP-CTERM sorting domain-containing protein [Thiobacillus sp.]